MKKVILITGASSGIGLASAKKLLSEGHIVYGSTRKEAAAKELASLGGIPLRIEMEDDSTMKSAIEQIIVEQGKIDVLFNNAGYGHYGPIEEVSQENTRKVIEVNLFGLARMTQLVLPYMRKQGSGRIINTSSIGGKMYTPLGGWYHASKHAVEGLSDCLRLELESLNIDVVIIEPGIIDTGFNERMVGRIQENPSSGGYEKMKQALVKGLEQNTDPGSPPTVIADLVSKAVNATKPKTRYHGGQLASLVLFVRRFGTDRFFDKFVMSRIKSRMKK